MISGHGGNVFAVARQIGCEPEEIIDFSSNINPLGTIPELLPHLCATIGTIVTLPEVDNHSLEEQFGRYHDISPECILAGSGTTQFIYALPGLLGIQSPLIVAPTYADYEDACRRRNIAVSLFMAAEKAAFMPDLTSLAKMAPDHDAVVICNPNNPTGRLIPGSDLYQLCKSHPLTYFVIDESYLPFVSQGKQNSLLSSGLPNVVVLHSLSKIFGIPGLRIGFMVAPPKIAKRFKSQQLPWNINTVAQKAAGYLLTHKPAAENYIQKTCAFLQSQLPLLSSRLLKNSGVVCYPSTTSYVLIRLPAYVPADKVCNFMASRKILIRNCSNFRGLNDRFLRIALKDPIANTLVADVFAQAIDELRPTAAGPRGFDGNDT